VQGPIEREDSSTGSAGGCKVRGQPGIIIDPAVDAGVGATRRRNCGAAGGRDLRGNSQTSQPVEPGGTKPGQPGDRPLGAQTERRFGATRRFTVGVSRKARKRGQPRGIAGRRSWGRVAGATRRLDDASGEGRGKRGNPEPGRRQQQMKVQAAGKPDAPSRRLRAMKIR